MKKYDYFTKETKSADCHVLYGWGKYPSHSVLAGQSSKSYLRSFDTSEELEAFMSDEGISGEWSNQCTEPQISLNHLSDRGDN